MTKLLAEIIPLALAAAVSPLLLVAQVATLTQSRPIRHALVLAAGAAVPLLVVAAIAVTVGSSTSLSSSDQTKAWLDLVLGLLLLLLGLRALVRVKAPTRPPTEKAGPHSRGIGRAFVIGIAAMATNITTFAFYIPAFKFIAASHVEVAGRIVASLVVVAITLTPALLPLALTALAPHSSQRVLQKLGDWLSHNKRVISVVLALGFGTWLFIKGLLEV